MKYANHIIQLILKKKENEYDILDEELKCAFQSAKEDREAIYKLPICDHYLECTFEELILIICDSYMGLKRFIEEFGIKYTEKMTIYNFLRCYILMTKFDESSIDYAVFKDLAELAGYEVNMDVGIVIETFQGCQNFLQRETIFNRDFVKFISLCVQEN